MAAPAEAPPPRKQIHIYTSVHMQYAYKPISFSDRFGTSGGENGEAQAQFGKNKIYFTKYKINLAIPKRETYIHFSDQFRTSGCQNGEVQIQFGQNKTYFTKTEGIKFR